MQFFFFMTPVRRVREEGVVLVVHRQDYERLCPGSEWQSAPSTEVLESSGSLIADE